MEFNQGVLEYLKNRDDLFVGESHVLTSDSNAGWRTFTVVGVAPVNPMFKLEELIELQRSIDLSACNASDGGSTLPHNWEDEVDIGRVMLDSRTNRHRVIVYIYPCQELVAAAWRKGILGEYQFTSRLKKSDFDPRHRALYWLGKRLQCRHDIEECFRQEHPGRYYFGWWLTYVGTVALGGTFATLVAPSVLSLMSGSSVFVLGIVALFLGLVITESILTDELKR